MCLTVRRCGSNTGLSNRALQSLDGLPALDHLSALVLEGNPVLTSLAALSSYTSIDSLSVISDSGLTGFEGLERLSTISEALTVTGNSSLTSLHALKSLSKVTFPQFSDNPRLPQCELDWFSQQTQTPAIMGDGPTGPCP